MLRAEVLTGLPPDRILHDLNELAQEDLAQSQPFCDPLLFRAGSASRGVLRYAAMPPTTRP